MQPDPLLGPVERYYSGKVAEHGPTAKGVDWNDEASQELRFAQLLKVCELDAPFTINDYGCGYGALARFLAESGYRFRYTGFDISEQMLEQARALVGTSDRCRFVSTADELEPADYTVASGIFNVRLEAEDEPWERHVLATLAELDSLSERGFAFNMLTSYSDPDRMRPDLYYADPRAIFDHCKRSFSRWVALLHDYGLYEFTILVRKEAAPR
jgi:SAM-dependent methyltransferase